MEENEVTEGINVADPEAKEEPQTVEEELAERIEFYKNEQKKETGEVEEASIEPKEEASEEAEGEPKGEPETPPESDIKAESSDADPAVEEEAKQKKPKKSADERINELVFQREQEKREKEAVLQEIADLKKSIAEGKSAKLETAKPKLNEELNRLRKERLEAARDLDNDKTAELDDQIFDAMLKISEETARTTYNDRKQNEAKTETDNAIKDFQNRNVWMQQGHEKYNPDKAAHAEGVYREMSENYTGSTKELLKKVEARTNKVFDSIIAKQKPPVSIVGKVNTMRSAQKQDDKLPTLSEEQKRFAHRTYQNKSKPEAEKIYARNVKKYANRGSN